MYYLNNFLQYFRSAKDENELQWHSNTNDDDNELEWKDPNAKDSEDKPTETNEYPMIKAKGPSTTLYKYTKCTDDCSQRSSDGMTCPISSGNTFSKNVTLLQQCPFLHQIRQPSFGLQRQRSEFLSLRQ